MAPQTLRKSHDSLEEQEFLCHRSVTVYCPSEQRAILVHRFYLSIQLGHCATVEETLKSWETESGPQWRERKMQRDKERQLAEIKVHKYHLSQIHGRDVGWEFAAAHWVKHHAAAWRQWWEEQPECGG